MAERFVTQWETFLAAVPASPFRRGLGDTELIGTSTLPNRAIHRGIMKPFSTCIASVFEAYAGSPDPDYRRPTRNGPRAVRGSASGILDRFVIKALNRSGCSAFRTRMAR